MQDWQLPYLGRRAFPAQLTDFELRQFFTFDEIERADIRRAFRSRLRLGAALQLGFLRLTGATLHSMEHVPAAVLKLLGSQLGMPAPDLATLRALYRRKMTRIAHQSWAIDYAGFRALDSDGEALLIVFLRDRTTSSIARPRLEQDARAWLHRNSYLIPRARWLTHSVRTAIRTVTSEDHAALLKAVGATSLGAQSATFGTFA